MLIGFPFPSSRLFWMTVLGLTLSGCVFRNASTSISLDTQFSNADHITPCVCSDSLGQFSGEYGYFSLQGIPEYHPSFDPRTASGTAEIFLRIPRYADSQAIRVLRHKLQSGTGDLLLSLRGLGDSDLSPYSTVISDLTRRTILVAAMAKIPIRLRFTASFCPRAVGVLGQSEICSIKVVPVQLDDGPVIDFYSEGVLEGGRSSLSFHVVSWVQEQTHKAIIDSEWSTVITRNDGNQVGLRCKAGFRMQECTITRGDAKMLNSADADECAITPGDSQQTSIRIRCLLTQ
jgi:hypothetical protein